ncbi:hypothetical protein J2Z69_000791 [Paenibacillus shirakamiensis]|uniref:DUF3899 domain-containing protein n=1 Tax=Paenibacillus shirakamiensis TaxID=1265935 RepID=A0ABS4JDH2_9BACL|nr:hypothetical protein [Paenibacillus shirakamiensis]
MKKLRYFRIIITEVILWYLILEALINERLYALIILTLYCFLCGYAYYKKSDYLKGLFIPNLKWYNKLMYKQEKEPERIILLMPKLWLILGVMMAASTIVIYTNYFGL